MALSLQRYTWSDSNSPLVCFLKERIQKDQEMSMVIAIKVGDVLSEKLMIEILSWLPVKTVLQFKIVCKSWYNIITSPNFISKHVKNYYRSKDPDSACLLAQYYISQAELQLFEVLVDETPRALAHEVLYDVPLYGSYVCGPCDGLYYLYCYEESGQRALWNPAINELKMLPVIITKPNLPSNLTFDGIEVYGFGYDPSTEDYKVVIIKGYWSSGDDDDDNKVTHPLSVLVYSLNNDSWKYCGDLAQNYELELSKCYVCVNGCYYWLGSSSQQENNSDVIICFDFVTDAFKEVCVPNYEQPASKSLGIYQDSVAFLTFHETDKHFSIWTLDYEIWTKKFTMGPFPEIQSPIGHWKRNKFLLESENGKLVLCDTDSLEINDIGLGELGATMCRGIYAYKESLVSIKNKTTGSH